MGHLDEDELAVERAVESEYLRRPVAPLLVSVATVSIGMVAPPPPSGAAPSKCKVPSNLLWSPNRVAALLAVAPLTMALSLSITTNYGAP